jgi:predicted O-linked N-acetylglucosamine transferase (SPINDLY family)
MTENNLKKAAQAHGIPAERLVFAKYEPKAQHLARHRLANLFLDTIFYNAHTTASDALWAGLPLITCLGNTFAARVAASLLTAVGLPELITTNLEDYTKLAINLAKSPQRMQQLCKKLADNRLSQPLFDTPRFTRNLERAYLAMWDIYAAGQPPRAIKVMEDGGRII